jgi:asparagine synthase (glutamine-hydrolysing)
MLQTIKHRGPDSSGCNNDKQVQLAMRRLSIIDVSGGDQPLYNEDKSIEIIGNGEIYNYIEIKKKLGRNHKYSSKSDIEIAVHAYEQWGLKCVDYFRGMFALAINDKTNHKLILIRDRMGEKPLYYAKTTNSFIFSSELKSILKHPQANRNLDYSSINNYFHFYYIPEPATPFENIKKLKAGHMLIVDTQTLNFQIKQYWNPYNILPKLVPDPTGHIKKVFTEACEFTLRSDVPVGIALSGGIDSGSILALTASKYKGRMNAFSIGYEGRPKSDERNMAKDLAKRFKVNYIESELKTKDVVDHFSDLVWEMDDPIADIAGHSIYEVSRIARKHNIKVLLGGVGGDELFWGYPSTIEATKQNIKNSKSAIGRLLTKKFIYNNPNPLTTAKLLEKIYAADFNQRLNKNKEFYNYKLPKNEIAIAKKSMDLVRDIWLASDVIALNDRLSMASSVELRSPFLDYKLVELAYSSVQNILAYNQEPKYYFKKAMRGVLPNEVIRRPKKGFTPPVADWIGKISKRYSKHLKNGFLVNEGIIDKSKLTLLSPIITNLPAYATYQLILFELWGREYVYNQKPENLK